MTRRAQRTSDMHDLPPQQLDQVRGGDGDAEKKKRRQYDAILITKPIDQASPML
jgi:hypothetical protein